MPGGPASGIIPHDEVGGQSVRTEQQLNSLQSTKSSASLEHPSLQAARVFSIVMAPSQRPGRGPASRPQAVVGGQSVRTRQQSKSPQSAKPLKSLSQPSMQAAA